MQQFKKQKKKAFTEAETEFEIKQFYKLAKLDFDDFKLKNK